MNFCFIFQSFSEISLNIPLHALPSSSSVMPFLVILLISYLIISLETPSTSPLPITFDFSEELERNKWENL